MLSYRHSYHAGNYADVVKHIVQIAILQHLNKKDKAYCVIDTHAGAGGYQLLAVHAQKTLEYKDGIGRLWSSEKSDLHPLIQQYIQQVRDFNRSSELKSYPGSPWFSLNSFRDKDKLFLHEIHPSDHELLTEFIGRDRQVTIFKEDGFKNSIGLLPPIQKRGMVFIDPPYEMKEDYQAVVNLIKKAHKRFAGGIYAIWYPVVLREKSDLIRKGLIESGIKNIQCFELGLAADTEQHGMTASGMIVINPPWTLANEMQQVLPQLTDILTVKGQGYFKVEQWVEE